MNDNAEVIYFHTKARGVQNLVYLLIIFAEVKVIDDDI